MSSDKTLCTYLAEESAKQMETLISDHCIPHFISFLEQRAEDNKTEIPTKNELQEYFSITSYSAPVTTASGGGGGSKKPLKEETVVRYTNISNGTHDYCFDKKRCIRYKAFSDTFCAKGVAKGQKLCDACYKLTSSDKLIEETKESGFSLDKHYASCVEKSVAKAKKSLGTKDKAPPKSNAVIKPSPDKKGTTGSSTAKKTLTSSNVIPRPYKKGPAGSTCFWIKVENESEAIIVDSNFKLIGVAKSSINPMSEVTDTAKTLFKNKINEIKKAIESKLPQDEKKEVVKTEEEKVDVVKEKTEEKQSSRSVEEEEIQEEPTPKKTINRTINPRAKSQPKKEEVKEEVSEEAENLEPEEDEEKDESIDSADDVSEEMEEEEELSNY